MPQHVPNTRVCRDCDGFATAAITTGARHRDGTRVTCRACEGTGRVPTLRSLINEVATAAFLGR
jgi:RNase P subunit RPR2